MRMNKVCSTNFVKIFKIFNNQLNDIFHKKTKRLKDWSIRASKGEKLYQYLKIITTKDDIRIEIDVLFDKVIDDYLFYNYNILFNNNKLMFHYEPTHHEHFQPHINVYINQKELRNQKGEGIHVLSHKYHPFDIIKIIQRYFR